jgi:hypothetical protein
MSILKQRGGPLCRDCRQPLPPRAKVCLACKAYQDWRRYLSTGQANLALVIALISVLTTAGTIFKNITIFDDSILVPAFQDANDKTVIQMVSNEGSRPGTVLGGTIIIDSPGSRNSSDRVPLSFADSIGPRIVEPGKTILVMYDDHDYLQSGTKIFSFDSDSTCTVALKFTSFKGKHGLMLPKSPTPCVLLNDFILKFPSPD